MVLLLSILLFYIFSNRFIVDEILRVWEVRVTPDEEIRGTFEAGILPAGNMVDWDKEYNRLIFREHTDRIFQTIDLYKNGHIEKVVLTGGSGSLVQKDHYEAAYIRRYLLSVGIPDSVIFVDSISRNTHENAVNTSQILSSCCPTGKFLLITSAVHMRRTEACFRKEGIEVVPYVTDKLVSSRRYDPEHLFVPHISSFVSWHKLLHEMTGYLVYDVVGYI